MTQRIDKPKEKAKRFGLYTKYRDEFLFCKRVLNSCGTKVQVNVTNKWFRGVLIRWKKKFDSFLQKQDYSFWEEITLSYERSSVINEMRNEWEILVDSKYKSMNCKKA